MSAEIFSSACLISSWFCFWAIWVWDSTLASLAALSASAWAMAMSRSAWALAMAAFFLMREVFSAPRSWIRPFSSWTFWMLQERISMPSFSMSLEAFCIT